MNKNSTNISKTRKGSRIFVRRIRWGRVTLIILVFLILMGGVSFLVSGNGENNFISAISDMFISSKDRVEALKEAQIPEWIDVQLLDVDGESRSGKELKDITGIVIHYVGNPNTTAQANRNYFNMEESEVSSHFVVGLEGEIIQCLPLYERSVASNSRNNNTISIEVCHPDESGKFNDKTYASLVKLAAWLCNICDFSDESQIIRHYDVVGKLCPVYYVENPEAWEKLQNDILKSK